MHLCTLRIICNVSFLTSQKEEHKKGGRHIYNELNYI